MCDCASGCTFHVQRQILHGFISCMLEMIENATQNRMPQKRMTFPEMQLQGIKWALSPEENVSPSELPDLDKLGRVFEEADEEWVRAGEHFAEAFRLGGAWEAYNTIAFPEYERLWQVYLRQAGARGRKALAESYGADRTFRNH